MSYTLIGFAVDIAKVESIVNSKDTSLVDAVMANNPDEFDLEDEDDEEDDDDDELSLAGALRQLIMGEEKDPEEAHQYGYAFQEICDYSGETLPTDLWCGVRWSAVELCGLEKLLTETGAPVDLPPSDDFPTIGHLRRGDVAAHLLSAKDRRHRSQEEEIQELLDEYIDWLETAADKDLDIVFFYQ